MRDQVYVSSMQNQLVGFMLLFVFLIGCSNPTHSEKENEQQSHDLHWDYEGQAAPEHWAELSPEFIACAEGHFQSPIDLETYQAIKYQGGILEFHYHASPIDVVNNGHTIMVNVEERNHLLVNEVSYELKQVHFHAPAEHQIDGIVFPMEMHMVHVNEEENYAVVGIFIKEGLENVHLKELWECMPAHFNEHQHAQESCDLRALIPQDQAVIHYTGSLTTPPCSEGVEWYVMETPIEMSKDQINAFKNLYDHNNRPIQNRSARVLEEYK
jgi:carbonic anhydrase